MKYADVEGLAETHLLPAVRGGLLSRLRRTDEGRDELRLAAERCGIARERAVPERKAAALG